VDPQHHDKTFVVTFLAVLAFLGSFTLGIIVISNVVSAEGKNDPGEEARIAARIKPVGLVVTDAATLMAMTAAATPAHEPMTGAQVVTKVCSACHGAGVLGAPKIGDKAEWSKRKAAGLASLVSSATKGKNSMPPRGGDASLSDDEIKGAIQEMLKQTGV
jgi:cytochrome c5